MEKEANQLYRRPQMTGQARDEEEEVEKNTKKVTLFEQLKLIVYSESEMNDS